MRRRGSPGENQACGFYGMKVQLLKTSIRRAAACRDVIISPVFRFATPMRIITLNLNGIRSAERKGFFNWLDQVEPWDVVCVQELKAQHDDLSDVHFHGHCAQAYFHPAEKRGYSGVGIYAHRVPDKIHTGFGSAEF